MAENPALHLAALKNAVCRTDSEWEDHLAVDLWCNGCIVALNLKNEEVERLAAEVAAMTNESKTEAIRRALLQRKTSLSSTPGSQTRSERAASIIEMFRAFAPSEILGKRLSRAEEDEILGFGPGGV